MGQNLQYLPNNKTYFVILSSMMKYRVTRRLNTPIRGRPVIKAVLLDKTEVRFKLEARKKVLGSELFENVCQKAKIEEPYQKYFGLQYVNVDGNLDWLKQDEFVAECPSSMAGHFQLAVKVFPNDLLDSVNQTVQKLIVFEVKENLLRGKLQITIQEHAILDSYFAQAMLGNFNEQHHLNGYLELLGSSFFSPPSLPTSFSDMNENLYEHKVEALHKSHKGMTAYEAFKAYLVISESIFGYGAFVYKGALDMNGKNFTLTVSCKGMQIFLPNRFGKPEELLDEFPWSTVVSLMYDNSKFLFSVCSTPKSLQMHSFRFKGHYGYLQAKRIHTDATNHRDLVMGLKATKKREKRTKSLDEISVRLERLLPGRNIDKNRLKPATKKELTKV